MAAADSQADAIGAGAERARRLTASKPRYGERLIELVLILCAGLSVLTTIGIVVALADSNGRVLPGGADQRLPHRHRLVAPDPPYSFGVLPLIVGTLSTTFWACLVALPFGLGAAIYLSEYASPRRRRMLKPALEVLAGIPTVVYGYFALVFVTKVLLIQTLGLPAEIFNPLSAGLVMGVMILPTVASLSDDAMTAVPMGLREGAYGLGASKMQVATKVVVPAALSGIVASFVLGVSRALGETMIVAIAAGNTPTMSFNPYQAIQTMTGYIANTALGDVATGSTAYKTIFAVAALLFVITFAMNMIAIRFVRRFREVYD